MQENITLEKSSPYNQKVAILDRYVFSELIPPFLFGIAVFTILFMATGPIFELANLVIKYGVPFWLVVKYAVIRLPSFVAYTLPMSMLLATLVTFGRLSTDHEIMAMKAGGVSFYRIFVPVLLFALMVCAASYWLDEKVGPESLYEAKVIVASHEQSGQLPPLQNIKLTSKTNDGLERITIAQSFDQQDGVMHGPVINDYAPSGNLLRITHAQEAIWSHNSWSLINGETFQFDQNGIFQSRMAFKKAVLDLDSDPRTVGLQERSPDEMQSSLLRKTIMLMEKDPMQDKDQLRSLWVTYHIRQALPFACLVFALVGAPSGIRPMRSGSQAGMATSVFIILIYYFFLAICKSLGEHGTLSAVAAAWLPNLVFCVVGGFSILKEAT